MRITFFVHRFRPSIGGVENYVEQLARALLAMGHHVDVVAGAHAASAAANGKHAGVSLPEHEIIDGLRVHRFPALRSPARCRAWLWRNVGLFRGADVVSVSNTHMLEYFWRVVGPAVSVRKVFLIRHGMKCVYPVPEADLLRARRSQGLAAGVAHDGCFISKWLGVEPDICPDQGLCPTADELVFVPEPSPTSAAFVGRLEPDTGIRIYIDAVARLTRGDNLPFRLDVYGDGSLMPELRRHVEAERLPVTFHGRQPDACRQLPAACFAFVDGRMAIQEAMARRRLVFAAYVNPLKRDYVTGESFSPFLEAVGSADELANRVLFYVKEPASRHRRTEAAYDYARNLNWARTAAEYLSFWQRGAATARPRILWRRIGFLAFGIERTDPGIHPVGRSTTRLGELHAEVRT